MNYLVQDNPDNSKKPERRALNKTEIYDANNDCEQAPYGYALFADSGNGYKPSVIKFSQSFTGATVLVEGQQEDIIVKPAPKSRVTKKLTGSVSPPKKDRYPPIRSKSPEKQQKATTIGQIQSKMILKGNCANMKDFFKNKQLKGIEIDSSPVRDDTKRVRLFGSSHSKSVTNSEGAPKQFDGQKCFPATPQQSSIQSDPKLVYRINAQNQVIDAQDLYATNGNYHQTEVNYMPIYAEQSISRQE